jgi:1,4-dihydroxy-2-naphthoate octaprenyltransferase
VFFYILASRAYSYRGIRLKRYPIIGFFTVVFFQGFGVYSMTYFACNISNEFVAVYPEYFYIPFVVSSVMVAGIYPLTQVFQHDADARNDDYTLSMMLGYRGTFFFSTAMFLLSALLLFVYFYDLGRLYDYFIFVVFLFPVLCFFFWWFRKVYYDERQANYRYTMMMNAFSAGSMNAYFLLLIFLKP